VAKPDVLSQIERDEELCIKTGPEPPQTRIEDGPVPLQTDVPNGPEPLQTPEEKDQKEKALGEDKVPVEAEAGKLGGCQEDLLPRATPVAALAGGPPAVPVGQGTAGHRA